MSRKNSIFNLNSIARVRLAIKVAEEAVKLQNIGVCHGDFSLGNLLIDLIDENLNRPKMEVKMIDYGLSF